MASGIVHSFMYIFLVRFIFQQSHSLRILWKTFQMKLQYQRSQQGLNFRFKIPEDLRNTGMVYMYV